MSDFHVVALIYRVEPSDHVSYAEPPPLVFETESARFRLEKDRLRCEMKAHVATSGAARALIDPILRDWEMEVELVRSREELRFTYETAEIIDRGPTTPGVVPGYGMPIELDAYLICGGNLTFHVTRRNYPDPPKGFKLTPDAESILLRFRSYQDCREPLLGMAYFCLTVVESATAGRNRRRNAAKLFGISEDVLGTLGDLTSNRGDRASARKAHSSSQPVTGAERAWIEATIKQLVLPLCDRPQRSQRKQLTMADLPPI